MRINTTAYFNLASQCIGSGSPCFESLPTMPIQTVPISKEQFSIILEKTEGHFCDFKAKEIAPAKLSQTLSVFANADGGEVYIGITNSRKWDGFINEEAANAHIQVIEKLFPIGNICQCTFFASENAPSLVLHIEVVKSAAIWPASDGTVYIRRGAQKIPAVTSEQIDRLKLNKGTKSFEDQTLATDIDDVCNSTIIIEFLLEVVPTAEPENWLNKQKLI